MLPKNEPASLTFPLKGGAKWVLRQEQEAAWVPRYPALNVEIELFKAWDWLDANPTRRKTARGMPRFLVSWLNRAAKDAANLRHIRKVLGLPAYSGWGCPHVEHCDHRAMCEHKRNMGTERYPVRA